LIWVVFNAAFVPIVYLFYPETANRKLEDIDRLYRDNSTMVLVCRKKDAIQVPRPQRYIDLDNERDDMHIRSRERGLRSKEVVDVKHKE
jgi:hypothetical protein